jgi:hypothetical protein
MPVPAVVIFREDGRPDTITTRDIPVDARNTDLEHDGKTWQVTRIEDGCLIYEPIRRDAQAEAA